MIVQKFWSAFMAQINKIANIFWEADPIAQMQYEYDRAVDELKEGRVGLEQYRGLVERVTRQVVGQPVARAEARGRDQGVSQGRRPRHRGEVRAGAAEGEDRPRRQRAAAPDARDRVRQQPAQDPARQQQAGRAETEDPAVRRRAQDERGRSRDRQARRELRPQSDDRLRTDRVGDPAEDRSEPRQGARRRGSLLERASPRSTPRRRCRRCLPRKRSPTSKWSSG